jgi:hypothetical protein
MKNFLKYLGSLIILIGVVPLLIYHFGTVQTNTLLVAGGVTMLVGALLHVLLNKKIV